MNRTENGKPRVYVSAMLCDRVIKDTRDFLTAVTITNGYSVSPLRVAHVSAAGVLEETPLQFVWQPLRVNIIITFVTEEPTAFETTVKITGPSGALDSNTRSFPVKTGEGTEGHTMAMSVRIAVPVAGEYWFEICLVRGICGSLTRRMVRGRSARVGRQTRCRWGAGFFS